MLPLYKHLDSNFLKIWKSFYYQLPAPNYADVSQSLNAFFTFGVAGFEQQRLTFGDKRAPATLHAPAHLLYVLSLERADFWTWCFRFHVRCSNPHLSLLSPSLHTQPSGCGQVHLLCSLLSQIWCLVPSTVPKHPFPRAGP